MNENYFIVCIRGSTYLPIADIMKEYHRSQASVYSDVEKITSMERYKNARAILNPDGKRLINTLVYEDYLYYKPKLKHKNLARTIPPYDAAEVRRARGEYSIREAVE